MPRALLPSIGTDIVKTSRFLRLLTVEPTSNGHPTRFLDKVFSVRERAAFEAGMASRGGGWSEATAVQFVASRWAAKEAVIKSVRHRKLHLRQVEIYTEPGAGVFALVQDPDVPDQETAAGAERGHESIGSDTEIAERAARTKDASPALSGIDMTQRMGLMGRRDEADTRAMLVDVSISHEDDYCVAVALAPPPDDK